MRRRGRIFGFGRMFFEKKWNTGNTRNGRFANVTWDVGYVGGEREVSHGARREGRDDGVLRIAWCVSETGDCVRSSFCERAGRSLCSRLRGAYSESRAGRYRAAENCLNIRSGRAAPIGFLRLSTPFYAFYGGPEKGRILGKGQRNEQPSHHATSRAGAVQNYKTLPEMLVLAPKPLSDINLTRCNHVQLPLSLHSLWPSLDRPRSPGRVHSDAEFGVRSGIGSKTIKCVHTRADADETASVGKDQQGSARISKDWQGLARISPDI